MASGSSKSDLTLGSELRCSSVTALQVKPQRTTPDQECSTASPDLVC